MPSAVDDPVDAVAQAWASIDGKLDRYEAERGLSISEHYDKPGFTGTYEGYRAEAEEMIRRLRTRGWVLTRAEGTLQ